MCWSMKLFRGLSWRSWSFSGSWWNEFIFFETGTVARPRGESTCGSNAKHKQGCSQIPRRLLEEIGGALHAANLSSRLKSGGETGALGVLDKDDCAKQNGDNQDEDEENVAHGVLC